MYIVNRINFAHLKGGLREATRVWCVLIMGLDQEAARGVCLLWVMEAGRCRKSTSSLNDLLNVQKLIHRMAKHTVNRF